MTFLFFAGGVPLKMRLDWGFENPNKTAALIAMLIVAAWALPAIARFVFRGKRFLNLKPSFLISFAWWSALAVSGALGYCLLLTGSRGGAVAAVAGLGALCAAQILQVFSPKLVNRSAGSGGLLVVLKKNFAGRKDSDAICEATSNPRIRMSAPRITGVAVVFFALFFAAFFLPQTQRFSPEYGAQDASIGNRLLIWKHVPSMIADAPGGWGVGNSGKAFMTWYQAGDADEEYRTLVNGHFTFLTESGWGAGALYLMLWALALRLAFRASPAAAGVLVAFGTAAMFSTVTEEFVLWILPASACWYAVCRCAANRDWPGLRGLSLCYAIPVIIFAGMIFVFSGKSKIFATGSGACVRLGSGVPEVVIVAGADAKESPRRFRTVWFENEKSPVAEWRVSENARQSAGGAGKTVVFLGNVPPETMIRFSREARRVILFSPKITTPADVFTKEVLKRTTVYFGEFSHSEKQFAWGGTGARCEIVPGNGDFISDWAERILDNAGR